MSEEVDEIIAWKLSEELGDLSAKQALELQGLQMKAQLSKSFWSKPVRPDAAIISMRRSHAEDRVRLVTKVFVDTLDSVSANIDQEFEEDILEKISSWSKPPQWFDEIPGLMESVMSTYNMALWEAKSKVKEARLKSEGRNLHMQDEKQVTNNYFASGTNSRFNFNSVDNSVNSVQDAMPKALEALVHLSSGNEQMKSIAVEAQHAWPDTKATSERSQNGFSWLARLCS